MAGNVKGGGAVSHAPGAEPAASALAEPWHG
jgi:hypothetical protein